MPVPLFRVFFLLFSLGSLLFAQGDRGGISGVVTDRDFGYPIAGAEVVVQGKAALETNNEGRFFIPDLSPGVFSIIINRDGYVQEIVENVAVSPGSISNRTIQLQARIVTLDEVSVEPETEAEDDKGFGGIEIEPSISTVLDILGEDVISKLPAGDAGKLLTKTVGTSIADGKFVVVRGLSDRYNTVYLNNARIPSSDPDRRAVTVDIFPSNLISNLSNTKTFNVENPGESTGGHINIQLKSVPKEDFIKFSTSVGYNTNTTGRDDLVVAPDGGINFLGRSKDLAFPPELLAAVDRGDPDLSAQAARLLDRPYGVTTGWGGNDFSYSFSAGKRGDFGSEGEAGILFAVTYDQDYRHKPDVIVGRSEVGIEGIRRFSDFLGSESEVSLLTGILMSGGVQFNDDHSVNLTFFTNQAIEDEAGFFIGNEDFGTLDFRPIQNQNRFQVREFSKYTERRLRTYQATGSHIFNNGRESEIDWSATYSQSSQNEPDFRLASYAVLSSPGSPFSPASRQYGEPFTSGNVQGKPVERIWRRLDDSNYNVNLNGKIPLSDTIANNKTIDLKIGAGYDRSTRRLRSDTFAYNLGIVTVDTSTDFRQISPDNTRFTTLGDLIPQTSIASGANATPFFLEIREGYDATQNVASFYTGFDVPVGKNLDFSFGGRAEKFDLTVQASESVLPPGIALLRRFYLLDPETGEEFPATAPVSVDSFDVLPMFSANFQPKENMAVRVVASRTVARPTFKEIAPVLTRDPTGKLFIGNRFLKTSNVTNFDARWEWNRSGKNLVAINAFTKFIDNPIEIADLNAFITARNEIAANVYGFEVEFNQKLDEFNPLLRDFSVGSNFTKIFSNVTLAPRSAAIRDPRIFEVPRRLAGQPDFILNFNLSYNNPDLGIDTGLFLNTTGELIKRIGGAAGSGDIFPDVIQRPVSQLDAAFSKNVFQNWKLTVKAENLLNTLRRLEYADGSPFELYRNGISYSIGLSGSWPN